MFIMAIIWRVMTFSKLTRLLWLCIFLVQLWKAKQVTITPWSILNTYTSGFNKNLKNLYIVFYSYKLQHKHDITSSCPYFIQTGQFCVKNMQITQFIPASGRSEKTTPPQDVKTYTSSKDWAIYMPKQRATGKQNPNVILPVSQIWALIVFPSTCILLVANSTPIVDLDSKLNSFLVNRDSRFDFPTPESPMRTTIGKCTTTLAI